MNEIENKITAMPFEQQPKESDKAFTAFKLYLELGPKRTITQVADKLGHHASALKRWSGQFDWLARVRAHTAYRSELERKAIEAQAVEKAVEWEKTHEPTKRKAWLKAEELLTLADDFLDRWRGAEDLPAFSSVVRGIELAFELKKFASGMPSEVTEVNTHVTGKIDLEWEMAIKRAYARKAQAAATVIDVEEVKPEKAPLNPNLNLNPSQSGTAKEGEVSK